MRWKQPMQYGDPETYYQTTWDTFSGMYILGEYPWRGRYEIVQPLMHRELSAGRLVTEWIPSLNPHTGIMETVPVRKRVDQKLVIHHMPLSHILIDSLIPLFVKLQALSRDELKAMHQANRKAQHRKEVEEMADAMEANMPAYFGPVSYSRQGCRTSLLDRKMEQIEKVWKRELKAGKRFTKGFQVAH
jgi:hypothetical protein